MTSSVGQIVPPEGPQEALGGEAPPEEPSHINISIICVYIYIYRERERLQVMSGYIHSTVEPISVPLASLLTTSLRSVPMTSP